MRFVNSTGLIRILYNTAVTYPAPSNISYFWNFGIYALVCLVVQIVTGLILVMHYIPHVDLAFSSLEHLMRDVNYGWVLRYVHANGASMFFIVVYAHLARGLFFSSYMFPRASLWVSGVLLMFLMIITAFLGYILPWGQMSFWGATVITNFASTIPYVGEKVVIWLWGAFSVDQPTLGKFFSLHYLLPFLIVGVVALHLLFLHSSGSSNPLGISARNDSIPFTPYFTIKDFFSVLLFAAFFSIFVFFVPNLLGHPDNYILANPNSTPSHIVPEWYFLPFYAILRAIPDKLIGVITLLASIIVLFFLPFFHTSSVRSSSFKPFTKFVILLFFGNAFILGFIGGTPVEDPFVLIGRIATFFYFLFFFLLKFADKIDIFLLKRFSQR
jgi:quinol-cytochrome oxidoreductase complex cytochrome b subunit